MKFSKNFSEKCFQNLHTYRDKLTTHNVCEIFYFNKKSQSQKSQ